MKCDVCTKQLSNTENYVDGKIYIEGGQIWASVCVPCHTKYGVGFGLGKGQLFDSQGRKLKG